MQQAPPEGSAPPGRPSPPDAAETGAAVPARPVVPPPAPDADLPASRTPPPSAPAQERRRRPRWLPTGTVARRTAVLCALLVAVLAAGTGAVVLGQSSPPAPRSPRSAEPATPTPRAPSIPGATIPPAPADVLSPLDPAAAMPSAAGVRRVLGPILGTSGLGGSISVEVVDLATGTSLFTVAPERPAVPASSAKLLTGAAALALLGPTQRLPTAVVDGAGKDEIVLVGGGDVALAAGHGTPGSAVGRAGIADLADQTAATLRAQGRSAVAVRLDDTLFKGPAINPAWSAGDVRGGFIAPVTALAVNSGSATPAVPLVPGEPAARVSDPAMGATQLFAAALERDGIGVRGAVARARAPYAAGQLARVESAPVGDLVEHALTDSDNTIAEALARLVAVKVGRPATFADAGSAVLDRLDLLGVPVTGARLSGGSGLGTGNEVPARTLARLLVLAGSPDHPALRPLLTGLPVAGASGTLADRFGGSRDRAGLGVVRAKTGTLTGASSLSGTVVDADGRQLGFVLLADKVASTPAARTALDDAASALAGCGCR